MNVGNGVSGADRNFRSLVIFANVNTVINLASEVLDYQTPDGITPISTDDIKIEVSDSAQRSLIKQQLDLQRPDYQIRTKTIYSYQDWETPIIILDLIPANSYNGSAPRLSPHLEPADRCPY